MMSTASAGPTMDEQRRPERRGPRGDAAGGPRAAVAGRHAQVGLPRLAGAVDDAAHHGDPQRNGHALETGLDLLGEGVDVDLGPAAGGAGDDLEAALAQVERLEDGEPDLDLLDRR